MTTRMSTTSSSSHPNPQNHLLRCGYLTKQGEIIQTWRRRWFVLRTHTLAYFKEEKANKPLRIIAIGGYKVKRVLQSEFCSKPFAFVLIPTRDKYDRPFLMYSDNLTDMIEWIMALSQVTEGGAGTRIESILTGEEYEFYRRLLLNKPPMKITQAPVASPYAERPQAASTDQTSSKRSTAQSFHEQDLQSQKRNSQPQAIPSKLSNSQSASSSAPSPPFQNGSVENNGGTMKKVRKNFLGSYRMFDLGTSPLVPAPALLTLFDGENPWETIDNILTSQWQKLHEVQQPQVTHSQSQESTSPPSFNSNLSVSPPQNDNAPIPIPDANRVSNNYAKLPVVEDGSMLSGQSPKTVTAESILFQGPTSEQRLDAKTNYSSVNPPEDVPLPVLLEDRSRSPARSPNTQRRSKSPEIDLKKTRASIRIQHPDYFAFWTNFLMCANFTPDEAMEIALVLVDNELGEAEVSELDHELLKSMGIGVAKTRIRILKMKEAWLQGKKSENLPLEV